MKKFGKTIKLFLIDGEPNGKMSCELSNWTGKAFKIPRKLIKECANRPELEGTGFYILIGKSENQENKSLIYIGEAEGIYRRLLSHLSTKDFWTESIVFVSKDENLNKAHIKYIENRLYQIAIKVDRSDLANSNIPNKPNISESDQAEMEEFIENVKLLVNTLGYKFFDELIENVKLLVNTLGYKFFDELIDKEQSDSERDSETVYIEAARGANGIGQMTNEGFVVRKGSVAANSVTASFPKSMLNLRTNLIEDGIIKELNGEFNFEKDFLFSSPSAAASIVMGRSANGLNEWKSKDGRVLKSLENE